MKDARDLAVSTSSAQALEHFETALTQFHSYTGDPLATMQQALQADPDFALAHLFNAFAMFTASEQRYLPAVRESIAKASALKSKMNARERDLLDAAELLVDGKWRDASRAFDSILIEYPHDALAIQTAHLMDFFQGDALNLRNRISRVLPHWNEQTPELFVHPRHARVRSRRMQSVSGGRARCAPRARAAAARRLGGARSDACDGNAGPHCRRHRVAAVARIRLGARQHVRAAQLVASGAVQHGPWQLRRGTRICSIKS